MKTCMEELTLQVRDLAAKVKQVEGRMTAVEEDLFEVNVSKVKDRSSAAAANDDDVMKVDATEGTEVQVAVKTNQKGNREQHGTSSVAYKPY